MEQQNKRGVYKAYTDAGTLSIGNHLNLASFLTRAKERGAHYCALEDDRGRVLAVLVRERDDWVAFSTGRIALSDFDVVAIPEHTAFAA